jgi:hypothetical protein
MTPSRQRLNPDQHASGEIDDRLKERDKVTLGERLTQFLLQFNLGKSLLIH